MAKEEGPREIGKNLIFSALSFLPHSLAPYSSIITIILLFVDGAIFGLAAKRGMMAAVLIIIGILVAGLLGLSAPLGLSVSEVISKVLHILEFEASHGGTAIIYTFPVFWIIGFLFGLWKG